MTGYRVGKDLENRLGPDLLIRIIQWCIVLSWLIMIISVMLFGAAKPGQDNFFDRRFNVSKVTDWNMVLMLYFFRLMFAGLLVSTFGFFINTFRKNRKTDHYRLSFFVLFIFSISGIFFYLFYF
ncbi:MAG: hypothetical protein KAI43_03265 [Candidatus Aureabacteria bacterium]|nr:hypothetical protein [Candidatus Auribacterota bacterium]